MHASRFERREIHIHEQTWRRRPEARRVWIQWNKELHGANAGARTGQVGRRQKKHRPNQQLARGRKRLD